MWQWRKYEADKVVDVFRSRQACVTNAKTRGYIDVGPKGVFPVPNT